MASVSHGLLDIERMAAALKEKRVAGKLTLRQASLEAGTTHSAIYDVECQNMPSLGNYIRLCQWLGVSLDTFVR